MNTAKNYKDTVKAIAPKVVKAICSGSDLYQWAKCHDDQVELRRGKEPTPVTRLIVKAPLEEKDGVKYNVRLLIEDIEDYAAKKITMFSTVTISGVATKATETTVDGKLRYVNYYLKVGKVSVEPCTDEALREFDEPIAQVCAAPDDRVEEAEDDE
jgi:hypothetical protein